MLNIVSIDRMLVEFGWHSFMEDFSYLLLKEKDHSRRWCPLKVVYQAVLFGKVEQTCKFISITFGFTSLLSILDLFVIHRQVY